MILLKELLSDTLGGVLMWHSLNTQKDICDFLDIYGGFHDCCLKELHYVSGAYVNEDLSMYPVNDKRTLRVLFQSQGSSLSVVEIEFLKIYKLNLKPDSEKYTCEILDSSMFFEEGKLYWADSESFKEQRELYDGTWICAENARWRSLDGALGKEIKFLKGV